MIPDKIEKQFENMKRIVERLNNRASNLIAENEKELWFQVSTQEIKNLKAQFDKLYSITKEWWGL